MNNLNGLYRSIISVFFLLLAGTGSAQDACGGPTDLLSFLDRPSVTDSACSVPEKNVLVETGYQYQLLTGGGNQHNVPSAVLRLGLADRFEVNISLPDYIHQSMHPRAGFTGTTLGVKRELIATEKFVFALEGSVTPSSGSSGFGSQKTGGEMAGVALYTFTSTLSISGKLGYTSQSESVQEGGQSFTSINPDVVLSWTTDKYSFYGELDGETRTGCQQGSGYNMDFGIIYLLRKNIAVDFEVGQRISGTNYDFNQYVGAGISFQMS